MNQVATFKKVSLDQFCSDILSCREWPFNDTHEEEDFLQEMYRDISLPTRSTAGSAGYDFVAPFGFTLKAGETVKFPTGIRCKIDDGWVLMIYPRSSLGFKYRLQLDNTVGIIDSDYYSADNEGDIHIKMTNDSKSGLSIAVNKGDRIAQGIFVPYGITRADNSSDVRIGGMGSTGR